MSTPAPSILAGQTHVVPIHEVIPYPGNPRRSDQELINRSLKEHGQYRSILVQRSTGYIVGGNHVHIGMRELGADRIAAEYLDVDDERARRIVLVDNRTSDKAGYDNRLLLEALEELPDLDGTGFDPGDLDEIREELDEEQLPTSGDAAPDDLHQTYGVYVYAHDEAHQAKVLEALSSRGYRVRAI